MSEKNCICKDRLELIRYKDAAISFKCPLHGWTTIDSRNIPAPRLDQGRPFGQFSPRRKQIMG